MRKGYFPWMVGVPFSRHVKRALTDSFVATNDYDCALMSKDYAWAWKVRHAALRRHYIKLRLIQALRRPK